jgi:hypothetical protein
MQRSAWLAIGAVCGALVAGVGLPVTVELIAVPAAIALAVGIRRQPAAAALSIGVTLILLRAAIGSFGAAPTEQSMDLAGGEHEALVLSIGTPGDGLQRAVLELRPPGARQRVYAWLPRYPAVFAGDVVRVEGRT